MKHNYHSHSKYCNHSIFTLEELILKAISEGFETFGVSEHMPNEGVNNSEYRLRNMEALNEYITEIDRLKEKYKDQIRILAGLECEITHTKTSESTAPFVTKLHDMDGIDYLILGHHTYDDGRHVYVTSPTRTDIEKYVSRFKEALDLGIFSQVAHPDSYFRGAGKLTEDVIWATEEITKYAALKGVPLGININGIVDGYDFGFPNIEFWKIASKNNATAILELDAHDNKPFEQVNIDKALKIVEKTGVKLIHKLEL